MISANTHSRLELKSAATGWRISGYASVFGLIDDSRDVVAPGAFARSLARRGARNIRMLFQHDPGQPIGIWDVAREDARGLYVEGSLAPGSARAAEIASLLRAGAIDGLSIGFRALKAKTDRARKTRQLIEIDLWEVSIVTFPMQPLARARLDEGTGAAGNLAVRGRIPLARRMREAARQLLN
ncbi:MAG: HK97 family phage prohead protease [Alphaproteobacteria bacterium]|nr:HK97 family phage prohead protease [Alphaproteobacteria bacterium]